MAGAVLLAAAAVLAAASARHAAIRDHADRALAAIGLELTEIAVSGHNHTREEDVFTAVDAGAAKSILMFDAASARKRIEALPWVATAQLSRELSGTLRVQITERAAVAVWADGGRDVLLDATGRRLAFVSNRLGNDLLRVMGAGAPEALAELRAALSVHPAILSTLARAERIGGRRWSMHMASGGIVHLPERGLAAALQRYADVEAMPVSAEDPLQRRTIDLRHPEIVAIRDTRASAVGRSSGTL